MKIMCPICLAEWDKDNILTNDVGITYEPYTWDRKSKINYELAQEMFEAAENSEYIEYSLHGNLHGNYDKDGKQITEMEYFEYKNEGDELLSTMSEEQILRRIDLFFRIYDSWGFKKKIRSFVAPNGIPKHLTNEELLPLASALKKRGITYWTSRWKNTVSDTVFFDGITYLEKNVKFGVPWNAYDFDPKYMKPFAEEGDEVIGDVLGMHWPNFLRFNAENCLSRTAEWADYFKKQAEVFGLMLAKDIAFSTSQHVYKNFSKLEVQQSRVKIDITEALEKNTGCLTGEFFVSFKNGIIPKKCINGEIELFETHGNFKTYKIKHKSNVIEIEI
ncbi:MAG: hypothetical protein IKU45_06445 [Clostridia bacterium]|nr:hypothetical protein [Clostridia bacterium]